VACWSFQPKRPTRVRPPLGRVVLDLPVGDGLDETEAEERCGLARGDGVGSGRHDLLAARADGVGLEQRAALELEVCAAAVHALGSSLVDRAAASDHGREVAGDARDGVEDGTQAVASVLGLCERLLAVPEQLPLVQADTTSVHARKGLAVFMGSPLRGGYELHAPRRGAAACGAETATIGWRTGIELSR
jgi:hypothetical protein